MILHPVGPMQPQINGDIEDKQDRCDLQNQMRLRFPGRTASMATPRIMAVNLVAVEGQPPSQRKNQR